MERTVDGRFRLRKALGAGAFGEVWLADDLEVGVEVALKLLKPEVAARPKTVERFAREVEVLRVIDHKNVVRVVAAQTERPPLYLAMELAPGVTLRDLMWARASSGARFTADEIVHVIDRLTSALAAVHAQGAVHRDLKPTNVMVTEVDGAVDRVCLLDLGIAKVQVDASDQTTVGRMMGTLMYMSPEQIRGEPADERADQFALAVIAYELATLRRPFALGVDGRPASIQSGAISSEGANAHADIVRRIVFEPRPRAAPYRPDFSRAFDEAVHRALAFSAKERFDSCEAFRASLLEALRAPAPARAETGVAVDSLTRSIEAPALTAVLPRELTSATPAPTQPVAPPRPRYAAMIGFLLAVMVGVAAVVASRVPDPVADPVERVAPQPGAVARPADDRGAKAPSAVARPGVEPTPDTDSPARPGGSPSPDGARATADASRRTDEGGDRARAERAPRPRRPRGSRRPLGSRRADIGSPPPPPAPSTAFDFDASDPASVVAAAKALERAAQRLPSEEDRTSVARCASLAGLRADASELAGCVERYEKAR